MHLIGIRRTDIDRFGETNLETQTLGLVDHGGVNLDGDRE